MAPVPYEFTVQRNLIIVLNIYRIWSLDATLQHDTHLASFRKVSIPIKKDQAQIRRQKKSYLAMVVLYRWFLDRAERLVLSDLQ